MSGQPGNANDAYARQQGFPDYATMRAFYKHRSTSLQDSHTASGRGMGAPAAGGTQMNGSLANYLTPFGIVQWVGERLPNFGGQ